MPRTIIAMTLMLMQRGSAGEGERLVRFRRMVPLEPSQLLGECIWDRPNRRDRWYGRIAKLVAATLSLRLLDGREILTAKGQKRRRPPAQTHY